MKKIFMLLIILFLIVFGMEIFFKYQSGFENSYLINKDENKYKVTEIYNVKSDNNEAHYHIVINYKDNNYNFYLYENLNKSDRVISNIINVNDCLIPVFKNNNIYLDGICKKDGYFVNLSHLSESNIEELKQQGYNPSKWNQTEELEKKDEVEFSKKAIVPKHYIGVNNYKGLYTINETNPNTLYNNVLFKSDVYKSDLKTIVDNYYIIYNSEQPEHTFTIIDITKNNTNHIKIKTDISKNSFIQGVYKDKVYIVDGIAMKQYELLIKDDGNLIEVGNVDNKFLYFNGTDMVRENPYDIIKEKRLFKNYSTTSDSDYYKLDELENGIRIGFKRNNNLNEVYRINKDGNINQLFIIDNITNVKYKDDAIYFVNNGNLKVYRDITGIMTLLKFNELNFNSNIDYYIYRK